jgi:hypothetical protein
MHIGRLRIILEILNDAHYICHYGLADNAYMGICHYAFLSMHIWAYVIMTYIKNDQRERTFLLDDRGE